MNPPIKSLLQTTVASDWDSMLDSSSDDPLWLFAMDGGKGLDETDGDGGLP